jgi:hypothetical protein
VTFKSSFRVVATGLAATAVLCHSTTIFAQGCALCYTQAASASSRFIHALRGGILVLIFPPLLISVGIATAAYRKRNQFLKSSNEQQRSSTTANKTPKR